MSERFDAIVVGSGFGGAVAACRLAEAGARVLVLERGRRWDESNYPRKSTDPWLFHHARPEKLNGWLDLRFFRGMVVAQGAGVGGGSMCYSSVVMEAGPETFREGWPPEIGMDELAPYYEKVRRMMGVQTIPPGQHTHRYRLMERAVRAAGWSDRFGPVPLAVTFDPEYSYDLPQPLDVRHSKPWTNAQGKRQGTCVHLGNCDIGCDVRAKNTLDLNYVPAAESRGAEVRPLHLVTAVEPDGSGFRVCFDRLEGGRRVPGEALADRVVLAAGSLGTTELLLRCRDRLRTLPRVSRQLGGRWSPNANFLTPDVYPRDAEVEQGTGPTITGGLDFMDGSQGGERFFVEDDGFPNVLLEALRACMRTGGLAGLGPLALRGHLARGFDEKNPLGRVMVWLGEGIDAGDGRLSLGRRWFRPWRDELVLSWDVGPSRAVIDAVLDSHRRLSRAGGGKLRIPLYWRLLKTLVTVHPLGGARMGRGPDDGVVDHRGEVFGHPRLYVADGAALPRPTGRNPSMTIAAVAERTADLMTQEPQGG
jgi:cholesterol oxidase